MQAPGTMRGDWDYDNGWAQDKGTVQSCVLLELQLGDVGQCGLCKTAPDHGLSHWQHPQPPEKLGVNGKRHKVGKM